MLSAHTLRGWLVDANRPRYETEFLSVSKTFTSNSRSGLVITDLRLSQMKIVTFSVVLGCLRQEWKLLLFIIDVAFDEWFFFYNVHLQ